MHASVVSRGQLVIDDESDAGVLSTDVCACRSFFAFLQHCNMLKESLHACICLCLLKLPATCLYVNRTLCFQLQTGNSPWSGTVGATTLNQAFCGRGSDNFWKV